MADITVRLIWYKLGEVSEKMAEAGRSWYTELDFDSYVLDLLLLGWCTLGVVVIVAVNALVAAFGPLQRQPQDRYKEFKEGESLSGAVLPIETAQWFNSALNWFYLHYYHAPEFVDDWVNALNEQLGKLGGPVQARFDRIQSGSLPPKITHVSCEASPNDRFIIHARLESRDLSFVVFCSQQTHEGVKLTNVTASVLRLKGTLRIQSFREGPNVKISFNFEGKPEIKVNVKPLNPYQEHSELVDLGVVEANVRNSIMLAKTTFVITHLLMPGDLHSQVPRWGKPDEGPTGGPGPAFGPQGAPPREQGIPPASKQGPPSQTGSAGLHQRSNVPTQQRADEPQVPSAEALMTKRLSTTARPIPITTIITPTNEQISPLASIKETMSAPIHQVSVQNEPVQSIHVQAAVRTQQVEAVPRREHQRFKPQSRPEGMFEPVDVFKQQSSLYSAPPKPPRMVGDKRLLVKVIKANGLAISQIGSANAVCMLSTDEPIQGYSTSVVKNTQHPFWDEHFLFDITQDTQEVRIEVYDKDKPNGDDFIGEAVVYIEDLRKTPSSRQILRLHPQPGNFEYNTGSVTAEFLFMDPAEADLLLDSMTTTANNQLSPRRRIEVARSVTPGGTVVTKTTTTTERPQYGRHDPGLDGSPNYIEKNVYAEDSPRFSAYMDSSSNVSSGPRSQQIPTIESPAMEPMNEPYATERPAAQQQQPVAMKDKKKGAFGAGLFKRFGRKKRAQSADRTASMRDDTYLRPPEPNYGPKSKDDLELLRKEAPPSPNLKKSRTLGGSLKKLFRRSRKRSQTRGNDSRESSLSRGSRSKGPSRDSSLTRQSQKDYDQQQAYDQRASSVS